MKLGSMQFTGSNPHFCCCCCCTTPTPFSSVHPAKHPHHLCEQPQLLRQLLDAVAVEVQPVEAGQAANAGRHHRQLVLREVPACVYWGGGVERGRRRKGKGACRVWSHPLLAPHPVPEHTLLSHAFKCKCQHVCHLLSTAGARCGCDLGLHGLQENKGLSARAISMYAQRRTHATQAVCTHSHSSAGRLQTTSGNCRMLLLGSHLQV
jgi:hypothetical protein